MEFSTGDSPHAVEDINKSTIPHIKEECEESDALIFRPQALYSIEKIDMTEIKLEPQHWNREYDQYTSFSEYPDAVTNTAEANFIKHDQLEPKNMHCNDLPPEFASIPIKKIFCQVTSYLEHYPLI